MSRAVEESNRRLLRAGDALDRAYAQPLDVPTLAGIAHVSDSHFIRTFLATFGETPHRYLQRRRVERSMFMPRETDRSVTDICLEVGFTGLGTFSRTCRAIVGVPPTAYRRRADVKAVPTCFDGVDPTEQFQRSGGRRPATSVARMFHTIPLLQISQIYVLDQDEALDFDVGTLGLEVGTDMDLGFMRSLTVRVPGEPGREILLETPGPRAMDDAMAEQVRELVTKGATGGWIGLTTADLRGAAGSGRRVSPMSPSSASTASTGACGTRSATPSASCSRRRRRLRSGPTSRPSRPRPWRRGGARAIMTSVGHAGSLASRGIRGQR
jgi:AraC-like DNA-binding protein